MRTLAAALAVTVVGFGCGGDAATDTRDSVEDTDDGADAVSDGSDSESDVPEDGDLAIDTEVAAVVCQEDDDCAGLYPERKMCQVVLCNTANGKCGLFSKVNGSACTDYDACTDVDECKDGECVPGKATSCNDQNPCTFDRCETRDGCKHDPVQNACSDGLVCTKDDACKDGVCVGVRDDCDDANPCTLDSCDATLGCQHAPVEGRCDDGDRCTQRDRCVEGRCTGEAIPECTP